MPPVLFFLFFLQHLADPLMHQSGFKTKTAHLDTFNERFSYRRISCKAQVVQNHISYNNEGHLRILHISFPKTCG